MYTEESHSRSQREREGGYEAKSTNGVLLGYGAIERKIEIYNTVLFSVAILQNQNYREYRQQMPPPP